ncbi:hypothetical protein TNCV_2100781 [Trichonephila clavipes]|nr:hypothetical protein TNCV_2100781 [Trichonephila clavipes]
MPQILLSKPNPLQITVPLQYKSVVWDALHIRKFPTHVGWERDPVIITSIAIMPLSRMENTTFAMPRIIDSHDLGLRTVLQSGRPKENAYDNHFRLLACLKLILRSFSSSNAAIRRL